MLVEYRKLDTFLHRVNPRISLLFVLGIIIASVVWTDPIIITLVTVFLILLGFSCSFPWKQIGWFLKAAFIASAIIIIVQGFSIDESLIRNEVYKGNVLFYLIPSEKKFPFTLGGLMYGYSSSMKIYMVVIAVGILGFTADPAAIIQMLNRIPFASKHFVFIFSTAWRFIPQIRQQLINLTDAQKTRGMELEKGKLTDRIRNTIPVITPLLSNALSMSDQMALAMEARAFGSGNKNRFVKPESISFKVAVALLIEALLIILMLVAVKNWNFGVM